MDQVDEPLQRVLVVRRTDFGGRNSSLYVK
jgi:hypothetical protein